MSPNKPNWAPNANNTEMSRCIDKLELLKSAVNEFANNKMQKESDAVNFYDLVVNDNWNLSNEFQKFIKLTWYSSIDFWDKDTPESLFNDLLKANTIKTCIKLETSRKKIEEIFKWFYDIKNYSKIKREVKKKTVSELSDLLSSEISRNKLLKKIYLNDKSNIPKEKDLYDKMDKLFNFKWISLTQEQEKSIKKIISYRDNVSLDDINVLINCDPKIFKTIKQKQLLIKAFLPTINLQQLIDWKIIDKDQLRIAINIEYKSILKKYNVSEDSIWENLLIDPSDIIISTFTFPEDTVDKILQKDWLSNIVNAINKMKEDIKKNDNILNHLDDDKTNDSFIKYIEKTTDISSKEIKDNIKKLSKWNYIKISTTDKNWTEKIQYFYINNVDLWSTVECKKIQFTNITRKWWIWDHHSINPDPAVTYQTFFNLIKLIDSNKDNSIVFYDDKIKSEDKIDSETGEIIEEWKTEFDNLWLNIIKEDNDINNITDFKNALDFIDEKWKSVPIDKMSFIAKADKSNNQEESSFTVKSITTENIIILSNNEKFSFQEFLAIFKDRNCERFEKNDSFFDLIWWLSKLWDDFDGFKWLTISESWKIVPEPEKNNSDFEWIEYFIWDDWSAIQVTKISDWNIEFITWEYKESKNKEKSADTFKWKYKHNNFDEFYYYTRKNKLKPKADIHVEEEQVWDLKRSWSILKNYLSFLSIAEIIAWWKQLIDSIEQWLAQWNKLKSAKFAQSLGKLIPGFDDSDLQSFVEWEEKKTMQEITDWLKVLDSKQMMPKIKKILLNSSSHQYEIEAALMATLKYGTLYPKWDLKWFRWKYLWYQALWGNLDDIPKYKKSLLEDDPNVTINEEAIVFLLLKEQAWGKWKYKRRSKIHKEFQATLDEWINKELWDWEKDTWDKMTLDWRINQVMWELKNSTFANWIWWIEKIWWKWPTPAHLMNTIPFVITISWIARDFPQPLINKVMWLSWETPYTALSFNNKSSNIDLYSNVTEKVIESFDWKNWNMMASFKKIKSAWSWKSVWAAYDFWNEYWVKINSRLNLADWYIYANKEKDDDFGKYVEWIKWVHSASDFQTKSEDITTWVVDYKTNPLFLTWWKKLFRWHFNFNASWRLPKEWWILLKQVLNQLGDIKNLKLSDNEVENEKLQKDLYKELYASIEPAIRSWLWVFEDKWWDSPEVKMLKREWIDITEFKPKDSDYSTWEDADTTYWYVKSDSYNNFLNEKWDNYISGKHNLDSVDDNEDIIKDSISDILDWINSNDNKKQ